MKWAQKIPKGANDMEHRFEQVSVEPFTTPKSSELNGHREIIARYAAQGFEYAGWIPVQQGPSGKILKLDLVFAQK